MTEKQHVGLLIHDKLKKEGKTVKWLAEQIHCSPVNVYKIINSPNITTAHLIAISKAMNYNFICYYCPKCKECLKKLE